MSDDALHNNERRLPDIGEGWFEPLEEAFRSPLNAQLRDFLLREKAQFPVYPKSGDIFNAFKLTPFGSAKVVILGQDPYHGPGQAHGLCFSVPDGVPPPPSLQNMFTELERDLGVARPTSGNLSPWARQGVLLLNATLTVRANEASSHQGRGWEPFTDLAIRRLSEQRSGLVFLLWGRYAQNKEPLIDTSRHHVLKAPHPSPLSAYRGFIGCGHFRRTNELLVQQGMEPINWALP
jgi:uracil-DNA glycosylase